MRGNMQIDIFRHITWTSEQINGLSECRSIKVWHCSPDNYCRINELAFAKMYRTCIQCKWFCCSIVHIWSGMLYPLTRTTALYLSMQTQLVSFQNQQSICILHPPKMLYIQCNCDAIGVEWRESVTTSDDPLTGLVDHYFISADLLLLLYYWNPRGYWERWFRFDWSGLVT